MTDHQHDELDELLRSAAQDYNRPGETPRDRMWSEIRARRLATAQTAAPVARTIRTWFIPTAAAAVLVLGIALGRAYEHWTTAPKTAAIAASNNDSARHLAVAPDIPATRDSSDTARSLSVAQRPTTSAHRPPRNVEPEPQYVPRAAQPNLSYQLAVVEHLAGTEAMLTSFRSAAKRGEVDAQMTAWARNLLTTTRLLQSSSAAQQDPTMKRLLDDLELVLVQIAQYTSAGPHRAEELELIEHSIERRGVIGKLHTTIPDRLGPAGT